MATPTNFEELTTESDLLIKLIDAKLAPLELLGRKLSHLRKIAYLLHANKAMDGFKTTMSETDQLAHFVTLETKVTTAIAEQA